MALINSCSCLCDDHGGVDNMQLCGSGKAGGSGPCRDTTYGRSAARSMTTDGNQRQGEIQGPLPAYKGCKSASNDRDSVGKQAETEQEEAVRRLTAYL